MAKNLYNKKIFLIIIAGLLLVALIGGWYFWQKKHNLADLHYSAVFLSNNQVYFGKIISYNKNFIELVDIYYLQMKEPLQNSGGNAASSADLTLIKLGQELHGPTDKMVIPVNSVYFTEDLKHDSKVVRAIKEYKQ